MELYSTTSKNNKKITYYKQDFSNDGNGKRKDEFRNEILVVASPFPTIRFCLSLFEELKGKCKLIGIEYNVNFGNKNIMDDKECVLSLYTDDLHEVIEKENIEKAHFFCWCQSTKIVLDYYREFPKKFKSIIGIAIDFKKAEWIYLSKLPYNDLEKVKKITAVLRAARKHFLNRLFLSIKSRRESKKDSQLASFMNFVFDLTSNGLKYASLFDAIIESPEMLTNYFKMNDGIAYDDLTSVIQNIKVPFTILHGSEDRFMPVNEEDTRLFRSNKYIDYRILKGRTHFMLLDDTKGIVSLIVRAMQSACRQKVKNA